jgi:betaine-aldehyde dehydrogenase
MRVARAIETGVLSVNSSRSVFLEAPFGGVKESGLGRELGMAALEHYTETKTVFFSEE